MRKANIDIRDWADVTALMEASKGGHTNTVKALLEHGADIELQDMSGRKLRLFQTDFTSNVV